MWQAAAAAFLLTTVLVVSEGKNITVDLELKQHWDDNWEGQFCFPLATAIAGYEIIMHFTPGVTSVQQWEGTVIHAATGCATELTLVNQETHGVHPAGQYCVRMMGRTCGGTAAPTGTATLIDLTDDGMQPPSEVHVPGAEHMKYNYGQVLQLSIMFYEAQRSGKLPPDNRIPWRGDSALQDHGANGEDLTGGWYDAGDNVKFNFPMAWSTTMLCYSLLEFPEAYEKSGQTENMYKTLKWPLDYFIKCHTAPDELYVQVGSGGSDHGTWTSPERMDQNRPAYKIDTAKPGSDVAMETASAMACGSIAFKTKDPTYSATLLTHAKQIYTFAKAHQGFYSTSVSDAAAYYRSQNFTDENNWGALWLYWATNDTHYMDDAHVRYIHEAAWAFSWDEKIAGNHLLMYKFTQDDAIKADIESTMTLWSKPAMSYSPKCMAFRLEWGPLRYAANTAFFALMAAKYGLHADSYRTWAMCQINYALGDGGRSYLIGFGDNFPVRPHHRASSCPMLPAPCGWSAQQSPGPNPHVLYGALVGGPGKSDDYTDTRTDYVHNEVACDYNAGFQAAVAALLQLALDHQLPDASACASCPQP